MGNRGLGNGPATLRAIGDYLGGRWLPPVLAFLRMEQLGSILLLGAAVAALIWANSPWDQSYFDLLEAEIGIDLNVISITESVEGWVNDGLLAIFFFVVGLEIKRELVTGEINTVRKAALPMVAALGGMIIPALIYVIFNASGEGSNGWGIPVATDIAFAVGVLGLLGRSLPSELRIFLLSVAVFDDIGAIAIIAVFYTDDLNLTAVGWAIGLFAVIVVAGRFFGIRNLLVYSVLGLLFWVAVLKSGVEATIAGVILGLLTPAHAVRSAQAFRPTLDGLADRHDQAVQAHHEAAVGVVLGEISKLTHRTQSSVERLERMLAPWSSYLILPIFALANAGVVLSGDVVSDAVSSTVTTAIVLALPVGKLVGITGFTWLAVRTGLTPLPGGITWRHIIGVALLGGIGFTVSLFISVLSFDDEVLTSQAKIGVFVGSVLAGVAGYAFLRFVAPKVHRPPDQSEEVSMEVS